MIYIAIGLYVFAALFIFGICLETNHEQVVKGILVSVFWPISILVGMGIEAAKKERE